MNNLNGYEIIDLGDGAILVDGFKLFEAHKKDIKKNKKVFWYDPCDKCEEEGTSDWYTILKVKGDIITLISNGGECEAFINELYW